MSCSLNYFASQHHIFVSQTKPPHFCSCSILTFLIPSRDQSTTTYSHCIYPRTSCKFCASLKAVKSATHSKVFNDLTLETDLITKDNMTHLKISVRLKEYFWLPLSAEWYEKLLRVIPRMSILAKVIQCFIQLSLL